VDAAIIVILEEEAAAAVAAEQAAQKAAQAAAAAEQRLAEAKKLLATVLDEKDTVIEDLTKACKNLATLIHHTSDNALIDAVNKWAIACPGTTVKELSERCDAATAITLFGDKFYDFVSGDSKHNGG
jgi:hypothetical protein